MLRTVQLHGHLAERFGEAPLQVDIASPVEAVRALINLKQGFKDELRKGSYHVLIKHGDRYFDLDEKEISLKLGKASEVHFVPAFTGAKGATTAGVLKVVLGVALVAGAFFLAPAIALGGLGATAFSIAGMGISYGSIAMVGVSLAVAGVSAMLTPSTPKSKDQQDTGSNIISTTDNVGDQGAAVPIVLGRYLTGSVVMSVGLATEQIGTQGLNYPGGP